MGKGRVCALASECSIGASDEGRRGCQGEAVEWAGLWARWWARHGLSRWSGTRVRRWWASQASRSSQVWVRQAVAHRSRLLEVDVDTAARGVFEGLFGLVVEVVAL